MLNDSALAQLPTFSSFWLSPQITAPTAMAGSDAYQVSAHYRRQAFEEGLGYRTMLLSGQIPLYDKNNTRFGTAGLSLVREESGSSFLLSTTGALLTYLYDAALAERHHLVGGVQAGYFRRGIDWSEVTTNNQYVDGHFDPAIGVGEEYGNDPGSAFTTNIGLAYYFADEKGNPVVHVGAGYTNLNKGSFTYLTEGNDQVVPQALVTYSYIRLFSNPYFEVMSNLYWRNENSVNDLIGGLQLRKGTRPRVEVAENHIGIGLYYTQEHTGIMSLQLIQPNWLVGISYDMAFGNEVLGNSQNAVEVTIGWRSLREKVGNRNTNRSRKKLPWQDRGGKRRR